MPPQTNSSASHVQKKAALIGPVKSSPRCRIPSVAYLTPCRTFCFVLCCPKKCKFDRPPGSVPSSLQPILLEIQLSLKIVLLEKRQYRTSRNNTRSSWASAGRGKGNGGQIKKIENITWKIQNE